MTYVEVAIAEGPGTLVCHIVETHEDGIESMMSFSKWIESSASDAAFQTLTEEQAKEFREIHGGWIAVNNGWFDD